VIVSSVGNANRIPISPPRLVRRNLRKRGRRRALVTTSEAARRERSLPTGGAFYLGRRVRAVARAISLFLSLSLSLSFSLSLSLSLSSRTCVHPCLSRQEYRPWRTSRRARRSPRSDLRSVHQNCIARASAGEFGSEIEIETRATLDDTRTGGPVFTSSARCGQTRPAGGKIPRAVACRGIFARHRRETSASTETHGEGRGAGVGESERGAA